MINSGAPGLSMASRLRVSATLGAFRGTTGASPYAERVVEGLQGCATKRVARRPLRWGRTGSFDKLRMTPEDGRVGATDSGRGRHERTRCHLVRHVSVSLQPLAPSVEIDYILEIDFNAIVREAGNVCLLYTSDAADE